MSGFTPSYSVVLTSTSSCLHAVGNAEISVVADKCLIGACKIIASIRRVKRITEYQKKPKILDKKPDFKVSVLVSMHASPCVECAIGSSLKIDPLCELLSVWAGDGDGVGGSVWGEGAERGQREF